MKFIHINLGLELMNQPNILLNSQENENFFKIVRTWDKVMRLKLFISRMSTFSEFVLIRCKLFLIPEFICNTNKNNKNK